MTLRSNSDLNAQQNPAEPRPHFFCGSHWTYINNQDRKRLDKLAVSLNNRCTKKDANMVVPPPNGGPLWRWSSDWTTNGVIEWIYSPNVIRSSTDSSDLLLLTFLQSWWSTSLSAAPRHIRTPSGRRTHTNPGPSCRTPAHLLHPFCKAVYAAYCWRQRAEVYYCPTRGLKPASPPWEQHWV